VTDATRQLPTEAIRAAEVIPAPPGRYFSLIDMRKVSEREIVLLQQLEYRDDVLGFAVLIPRGFRCDGSSVPTWAWSLLGGTWLEWVEEGCLHDYLSRRGATVIILRTGQRIPVTCPQAAGIFREALVAGGARRYAARVAQGTVIAAAPTYWHRKAV
jgi:hypothetical protein